MKCKYCGKEIDGVIPAPMTCWTCYKNMDDSEVINNPELNDLEVKSSGEFTKKCEGCNNILPIDNFYKTGHERNKLCKTCVTEEAAQRCINILSIPVLRKMATSGVTAEFLVKEWNKTRSTCTSMMSSLVKTNRAYSKHVKRQNKYYMDPKIAEKLIATKKGETMPIESSETSFNVNGLTINQVNGKGIYIKNVPIHDLGKIIEELRTNMSSEFDFKIFTSGEYAELFISEKQIINWAFDSFNKFLSASFNLKK